MNLIFFRLIEVTETASMRVAHCFNFAVVTSINRENIIFSSYHLIFILFQRRNILALIYKRRIISNFWQRRDTDDVTIQFFGWCKNHTNFLTSQNKRYAITLLNIKWYKDNCQPTTSAYFLTLAMRVSVLSIGTLDFNFRMLRLSWTPTITCWWVW